MDQQFWGHDRCCKRKSQRIDSGKGRHRAVGYRIWERAKSNHAKKFKTIVFQDQRERCESGVRFDELMNKSGKYCSRDDERAKGSGDGSRCGNEPASHLISLFHKFECRVPFLDARPGDLTRLETHRQIQRRSNKSNIQSAVEMQQ